MCGCLLRVLTRNGGDPEQTHERSVKAMNLSRGGSRRNGDVKRMLYAPYIMPLAMYW